MILFVRRRRIKSKIESMENKNVIKPFCCCCRCRCAKNGKRRSGGSSGADRRWGKDRLRLFRKSAGSSMPERWPSQWSDKNNEGQLRPVLDSCVQRGRPNGLVRQLLHSKGHPSHFTTVRQLQRVPDISSRFRFRSWSLPTNTKIFGSSLHLCQGLVSITRYTIY